MRTLAALLAAGGIVAVAASAEVRVHLIPQDWFGPDAVAHSRHTAEPVFRSAQMGALEIKFEKTRLEDVRSQIGRGTIREQGDAAESEEWLCYRYVSGRGMAQIDLTSGEMDGGIYISGIILREGELEAKGQCPELPARFVPIVLKGGLGLGSTQQSFERVFGKPTQSNAKRTSWEFERQTRLPDSPEIWTRYQDVHAHFRDGKADIVLFVQSTSN